VTVTSDRDAAVEAVRSCLSSAEDRVVLEEYLDGPEVSLFVVVPPDGEPVPLVPAQDFKRVGDGDTGPNTGGMGAYSPLPWAPPDLVDQVLAQVVRPTVAEMARRGTPYTGLLYVGLALTTAGPKVVEFNCRFGDPETEALLPVLDCDLLALLHAAATGSLASEHAPAASGAAATVVIASAGYPEAPRLGDPIDGIDEAEELGALVLHAGTALRDGRLVSAGGRVLNVVGVGENVGEARERAYEAVERIRLDGAQHRSDIGGRAVHVAG
jgi:phosphoribosylamine--glycine ligase